MSVFISDANRRKRRAGMVLGDFLSLIGIMAFITGSQSIAGALVISGICLYTSSAATRWMIAKIPHIWHLVRTF